MPNYTKCFQAHSKIINLQVRKDDTIAFATTNSGIRIMDLKNCDIKSNILPDELHNTTTAVVFSNDAKVVAFANKNIIHIMVLQTQKILKTIELNDGNVDILSFDPSSDYLIVGTSTGRVLQYRYNSIMPIARLCSFPYHFPDEKILKIDTNFVSAFTFFHDKVACSGYGGSIYVINLHTRENTQIITRSRVKVQTLYFLDEDTLISGNVDGVLEIISLKETKTIKRLNTPFINIKNIVAMPSRDYILVSSNKKFISLINIKTLKVIDNKYLNFDYKIQKILPKNEESILVVLADNTVLSVELPNMKQLKRLIDENKLSSAYQLITKAPMLKGTQEHKRLEEIYAQHMHKATEALICNDTILADGYTSIFKYVSSKKNEIDLLYITFKYYDKFKLLFHENKYALAYSMAEKYPPLKQTIEFKHMEKKWKKSFLNAQKQVLAKNSESARVLLNDYMSVHSKRPLIKFILHKNSELINFLKAIEQKEFQTISTLIKDNQYFANMSYYKALNDDMDANFKESKKLMNIGNTALAKILIKHVEENPKYEKEATLLLEECNSIEELYLAYINNDLFKCYTLLDANPLLKTTELAYKLQNEWKKSIQKCEKFALKGDVTAIEENLGHLLKLVSRQEKTGDLLRLAYQIKISKFINKNLFQAAKEYTSTYTNLFGLDKEIKIIIKLYSNKFSKKITLTSSQARPKPKDFWLYA